MKNITNKTLESVYTSIFSCEVYNKNVVWFGFCVENIIRDG